MISGQRSDWQVLDWCSVALKKIFCLLTGRFNGSRMGAVKTSSQKLTLKEPALTFLGRPSFLF
jgi:hypothetical protein